MNYDNFGYLNKIKHCEQRKKAFILMLLILTVITIYSLTN